LNLVDFPTALGIPPNISRQFRTDTILDDMSQPGNDDHDDLDALYFSGESGSDDNSSDESAALDFSVADDNSGEESAVDALEAYAPAEPEDTGHELDAIQSVTEATEEEDEEGAVPLFTVTNPPETVSVSALIDGSTERIELSAKVASMTESELADEIVVLADLARQKGLAGQHAVLFEGMSEMGADDTAAVRDLLENGLDLSSPEQFAAAEAKVFATRYVTDND
jgi:hypothetical protein